MSKLSIITVTHDRAAQLQAQAMPSILAQSCQDFEWVVVNDGGDRATRQLIEPLQQQQPGFTLKYLEMPHPESGFALADGRNLDYEYFLHYIGLHGVDRCLIHWQPLVNYIQSSAGIIGSSSYEQWVNELLAILQTASADYPVLDELAIRALEQLIQIWQDKAQQQQPIAAFQS